MSYLRTMYYGSRIIEMNERDLRRAEKERQQRVGAEFKKIQPFFDRASELTNGLEPIQPQKVEEDKKPWELSEEEANKINPEIARETAEAKNRESDSKQLPDNIIE